MLWPGCWCGASPAGLRGCVPSSLSPSATQEVSLGRRLVNQGASAFALGAVVLVLVPLLAIFVYLVIKGIGSINITFLTQTPKPPGEAGGGMANAIVGTGLILAVASVIGLPLGIGSGIYLAEYGRNRFGDLIRFTADVLNGVPSIVIGIAVYSLVVVRQKHFSAFSGGVALGIMMIPTIARATEEMLLMVPNVLREAAYGLGIPKWRTTLSISLRTASAGVITGCMLAFARVAGETAPLLFTAFGNQFWNLKLNQPTAALSLQVYTYAISPYDDWHNQAWAGALIMILLIVGAVAAVRIATSRGMMKGTH
jgi:phosphate transport system permease protein